MKKHVLWGVIGICIILGIALFVVQTMRKPQEEPHVLRVCLWDYDVVSYDRKLIAAFEESHPHIQVEVVAFNSYYYNKTLESMLESGQQADVIFVNQLESLSMLQEQDMIYPIDAFLEKDKLPLDSYLALDALRDSRSGELLGLPYRMDRFMLYFNKSMFDEAGVQYPDSNMTWLEFEELAKTLQQHISLSSDQYSVFQLIAPSRQMSFLTDEFFSVANSSFEELRPGLELMLRMQEEGVMKPLSEMSDQEGVQRMFEQGDYGMFVHGSWFLNYLINDTKNGKISFEWGVCAPPSWKNEESRIDEIWQTPVCISRNTREREAAWEFVSFVCGPEGAAILAEEGMLPACLTNEVREIFSQNVKQFDVDASLLLDGFDYTLYPISEQIHILKEQIDKEYTKVMLGIESVDEGLQNMSSIREGWRQ